MEKLPAFYHTGFNSPITEFALILLAQQDDHFSSLGTAMVIGSHLAITASHVMDGFFREFGNDLQQGASAEKREGTFSLQAVQFLNNGAEAKLWNIRQAVISAHTDIALLALLPHTKDQCAYKWRCPKVQLLPPAVGSIVTAFGYHSTKVTLDPAKGIQVATGPFSSRGVVQEIHHVSRDSSMLRFPCYRVNSRFARAMSGGPVFSDEGILCGIVCAGMETESAETDFEHTSYVTTLWPLMGTELSFNREGHPEGIAYPALELARDGMIHAIDWQRIIKIGTQVLCSIPRELAENTRLQT